MIKKTPIILKMLLLAFFTFIASHLQAQDKLTFSTINTDTPVVGAIEKILQDAYTNLNITFDIKRLPPQRALAESNSGEVDGELFRIAGIEQEFPDLIRVSSPVYTVEGYTAIKKTDIIITNKDSIKPYKIGIVRGVQWAEDLTKGMNVSVTNDYTSAVQMLDKGRIDLILGAKNLMEEETQKLGLNDIKISDEAIVILELFHYLNKKHADLVPKISESINSLHSQNEEHEENMGY